jgi:hypothetical protein
VRVNWIAILAGLFVVLGLSSTTTRAQQCPKPATPPPICNFDKSFCAATLQTCSGTAADWSSSNTNTDDVVTGTVTQSSGKTTVVGFDSSSFTFINLNDTIQDTYDLYAWPSTFEVAKTGTFNLQGGTLTAGFEVVNGVMNQSGDTTNTLVSYGSGPNSQGAVFHVHCSGTDNTNCGSVVSSEDAVGSLLVSGGGAQYNLSGGTINGPILQVDSGGTFNQTGGTVSILPYLSEDANQPTGTLSSALYVGVSGAGTYNLSSGTLQVGGYYTSGSSATQLQATGNEYIGYNAGSSGVLNQSGGTNQLGQYTNPSAPSAGSVGGNLYVGYMGNGTYNQSGGTLANVIDTNEYVGYGPGSVGTFNQTGGANGLDIGTVSSPESTILQLYVGDMGHGNYTLGVSGGSTLTPTLTADFEYVGTYGFDSATSQQIAGTGNFVQNSGVNLASVELVVGNGGNSVGGNFGALNSQGIYTLNGGELIAGDEIIGDQSSGLFIQNGGINSVTSLLIGSGNAQNSPIGIYDLTGGTLTNCCSAEEIGVGAGTNGFFAQSGGLNQTLEISLGNSGTGTYSLTGGTLDVGTLTVGQNGTGLFNQTGGTVNMQFTLQSYTGAGSLDVGSNGNGTYNLGCPTCTGPAALNSAIENIGLTIGTSFVGTFNQYAGTTNTIAPNGSLNVAEDGQGVYNLYGGTLTATYENVGQGGGTGTFNQSGGTNNVASTSGMPETGTLTVGATGTGTYNLSGASTGLSATTLHAATENVGYSTGTGTFNQSGGVNNVSGTLTVGGGNVSTSSGFYNLSGGTLNAANEIIGNNLTTTSALTQTFLQTGGTNTVTGTLTIGATSGAQNAPGAYALENGSLTAGNITIGSAGGFAINPGAGGAGATVQVNVLGATTNNGLLDVFATAANAQVSLGNFVNNGTYSADPVAVNIANFTIGAKGVLETVAGDGFNVAGNFTNNFNVANASLASLWNVSSATLDFTGAGGHDIFLASTLSGSSFAWGTLDLGAGGSLDFLAGSDSLYVDSLDLAGGLGALADICGGSVYYDKNDSANSGLLAGGSQGTYTNSCGGSLIPFLGDTIGSSGGGTGGSGGTGGTGGSAPTPEPSTWLLLLGGLACLSVRRWIREFQRHSAAA